MYDKLGLGITLDFEDRASAKTKQLVNQFNNLINVSGRFVKSFNEGIASLHFEGLTVAGFALQRIGVQMSYWGKNVVKTFFGMGKAVVDFGAKMEKYQKTFEVLFKGEAAASEKIKWAMDYAAKTPFEYEDLLSVMKSMKAINVDVTKEIKKEFQTANTKNLLDVIGNLAILAPPEQGIRGLNIAIRNLFGGNTRSFMMRMDMNIAQILGHEVGKTTEEVADALAELSQKLTPDMMQKLFGTWEQTVSNFADQYKRLLYFLNDRGAFNAAKKTLMELYSVIANIDPDEMSEVGKSLSEVFQFLWKPIDVLSKGLGNLIINLKELAKTYPWLFKIFAGIALGSGVFMIAAGAILKFSGTILMAIAALATFYVNILVFRAQTELMNATLLRSLKNIGLFFKTMFLGAFIFAAAVVMYEKNMLGFRDTVLKTTKEIREAWSTAFGLIWGGQGEERLGKLAHLEGLARTFARIITLANVIKSLFTQDRGDRVWFSKKQVQDLQALGLWELTRKMVMLKGRVEAFFKGFANGLKIVWDVFKGFYNQVIKPFIAFLNKFDAWISKLTGQQSILGIIIGQSGDISKWERIGGIVGRILGMLIGFKLVKGVGAAILSPFVKLSTLLTSIGEKARWSGGMINKLFGGGSKFYYEGPNSKRRSDQIIDMMGADPDNPAIMRYSRLPWKRFAQQREIYGHVSNMKLMNLAQGRGQIGTLGGAIDQTAMLQHMANLSPEAREKYAQMMQGGIYADPMQGWLSRKLFGKRNLYFGEKYVTINGQKILVPDVRSHVAQGGLLTRNMRGYTGHGGDLLTGGYGLDRGQRRRIFMSEADRILGGMFMSKAEKTRVSRLQKAIATRQSQGKNAFLWEAQLHGLEERNRISSRLKGTYAGTLFGALSSGAGKVGRGAAFIGRGAAFIGSGAAAFGRGAIRVGGGALRGAGMVGGMALRSLPFIGGIAALLSAMSGGEGATGIKKTLGKWTDIMKKEGPSLIKALFSDISGILSMLGPLTKAVIKAFEKVWPDIKPQFEKFFDGIATDAKNFLKGLFKADNANTSEAYNLGATLGSSIVRGIRDAIINALGSSPLLTVDPNAGNYAPVDQGTTWFSGFSLQGMARQFLANAGMVVKDGNANGTDYWKGGWSWVGERGPEIVRMPRGSQVIPNHKLSAGGVTIQNMNLIVQSDVLSRAEARKQAEMIIEEAQRIARENKLRTGTANVQFA